MTSFYNVFLMQVLDALLSEYEKTIQGPGKWHKLAVFLQRRFVKMSFCQNFCLSPVAFSKLIFVLLLLTVLKAP